MGSVNIFLGGTGKHIAEDIQDSRDFYGHQISEPIAFDLDSAHRAGVDLRGFVHPSQKTIDGVADIARNWAAHEPGRMVGPARDRDKPGPQLSPEHAVLTDIGKGIARNPAPSAGLYALRGHGLTVFSALFDPALAIAGAGDGNEFRRLIQDRVREQAAVGEELRINLVTSTAGGTGAGTVIPLALWLRSEASLPPFTLNLIAVTPSAFDAVLRGDPTLEDRKAKGLSGTYAMFREISFFREVDPQTWFSSRSLPIRKSGLEYTPGRALFDRVYWFGGREGNDPRDAFEEAGTLLRLVSNDDTAREINAQTGSHPLQNASAITAIEYPKLRLQRKLVSRVLQATYGSLRTSRVGFSGGAAAASATSILDYVRKETGRKLGDWLFEQRASALALSGSPAPLATDAVRSLVGKVNEEAGVEDYSSVPRGSAIPGPNYDGDENQWRAYVNEVTAGLRRRADENQRKLEDAIPRMRNAEENAFAEWLRRQVFVEWLSGEVGGGQPQGVEEVLSRIDVLKENARTLEARIAEDNFIPGDTLDHVKERISACTDKLDKPDKAEVKPSPMHRILGVFTAVLVFVIGLPVLQPVWESISSFGEIGGTSVSEVLVWVGVILVALAAYRAVVWGFMRSRREESSPRTLRRRAQERLFAAYQDQDRVRAVRWLHQELRGRDSKPSFFRELRQQIESIETAVSELDGLYKSLHDKAAAEVAQAAKDPNHVRATVGDCLAQDMNVADGLVPEIARRLYIDATLDPGNRIRSLAVRLQPLPSDEGNVSAATVSVGDLQTSLRGQGDGVGAVAKANAGLWEDAIWQLVNWKLGEDLPQTFEDALARCEGDDGAGVLANELNGISFPRRPSVDLRVPSSEPVFRQMYAGSVGIQAALNRALQHPNLDSAKSGLIGQYALNAKVVPALGEQVVFLDLWADKGGQPWAPSVISNAVEASLAHDTYYAIERGAPDAATAKETCFTVIPELLAATKIELEGQVQPLEPVVTARLLGSDLGTRGPTYAELFYLLRARDLLVSRQEGEGPNTKTVVTLRLDQNESIALVEFSVGSIEDSRFFGRGRERIVAFDAFCEFMRFDGTPLRADAATPPLYTNANLRMSDWANAPDRVARAQYATVLQWYEGDVEADCEGMVRQLEADLQRMENGNSEVRNSWERAMRRLLNGDERRRIRSSSLN